MDADEAYSSSVSFLASDSEECEGHAAGGPSHSSRAQRGQGSADCKRDAQATKVYVWGLNDKDQLGGLKGSKIKLPVFSDTLGNLKPIHIAGGSKSLFTVTQGCAYQNVDESNIYSTRLTFLWFFKHSMTKNDCRRAAFTRAAKAPTADSGWVTPTTSRRQDRSRRWRSTSSRRWPSTPGASTQWRSLSMGGKIA